MSDLPTGKEALGMGAGLQQLTLTDAIDIQRPNISFWTASFDLDEYHFPSRASTMQEVLLPLTNLDPAQPKAFRTNQLFFGTSGWNETTAHPQIKTYMLSENRRNGNHKTLALLDAVDESYDGGVHTIPVGRFRSCVLSFWVGHVLVCPASQWTFYHGICTFLHVVLVASLCGICLSCYCCVKRSQIL